MQKEDIFAEVNERRRIRIENEKKNNESLQNIVIVNGKRIELLMPPKVIKEKIVEKKEIKTLEEQEILNAAITEERLVIDSLINDVSFEAVNKRRDARKKREIIQKELFGSI